MLCYEYKAGLPINPPSGTKVSKVSHTLQNIMKLTKDSFQLRLRLMVYQNIHLGCRHIWFDLMSGLFCPRLAPTLLCNSTNLKKQLLFGLLLYCYFAQDVLPILYILFNLDLDLWFIKTSIQGAVTYGSTYNVGVVLSQIGPNTFL